MRSLHMKKKEKNHDCQKKVQGEGTTQPTPSTPTTTTLVNSTTPVPTVATTSTQMPVTRSTATSIQIMVYNLATGKFREVPCPLTLTQNSNTPTLEDIPSAPVIQGTPWPNAGSASENLFETRKEWPIPPTPVPTPALTLKTEEPPKIAAIPHAMVMPKQATKKCSWGPYCLICKNEEEHEEDWDGDMQNQPRMHPQSTQCPQPQNLQHPQPQNLQHPPRHRTINILSHKTCNTPSHRTISKHLTYPICMLNR